MSPLDISDPSPLTPEEAFIVRDLVAGKTRKAIARDRGRSLRQLHRDIGDIRGKLNAANDMQLAIIAYNCGIVDKTTITIRPGALTASEIRSPQLQSLKAARG